MRVVPRELFLQVNITSRCNIRCTHCYIDTPTLDMPPDLFTEAISQFEALRARLGVRRSWIQLSGGEPMLHPRITDILAHSASRFPTKVLTNGTLIDARAAALLARHCESVQISFDGDRDVHDRRRGVGSFNAARSGLSFLRGAGVRVSARITVGADNCHCVQPLFRLLENEISAYHVSRVVPIGGRDIELPDTCDYRSVIYGLYAARATDRRIGLRDPFFGPLISTEQASRGFSGCGAGVSGMCVTETGDILPCRRLPIRLGNVRQTSLAEVYESDPLLRQLRERELGGRCGQCEHRIYCGGSRCIAFALTGDPLAEDPGCIYA